MKKRILFTILAAAICVALLATAVLADEATGESGDEVQIDITLYNVWVCGTQVTSANKDDVLGEADTDATVVYTPATDTEPQKLTLTGANLEYAGDKDHNAAIEAYGSLTVELSGENQIKLTPRNTNGNTQYGIKVQKPKDDTDTADRTLTIMGTAASGKLTVTFGDDPKRDCAYGLYAGDAAETPTVSGNVVINGGCTVSVSSGNATHMSYGIHARNGNVTIGSSCTVSASGGNVTNSAKKSAFSRGIAAMYIKRGGTVTITGGSVTARAASATSEAADAHSNSIYGTNISITGGSVVAKEGTATASSGKTTVGGIYVADNGKLTVSSVTNAEIDIQAATTGTVDLSGGSYNAISTLNTDTTLADYLAAGKAFASTDSSSIVNGYKAELTDVQIVSHTSHSTVDEDGKCPCGMKMRVYGSSIYASGEYYTSLSEAMYYCSDVKLLTDCEETAELSDDRIVSIDLNGKKLTALNAEGNSLELTIKDSSQSQTGYIGTLKAVYNTKLYGGSYGTINGSVHAGMLPEGYAFRHTGSDTGMVKRSEYGSTLTDVTVVACNDHSIGTDDKCEYCNTQSTVKLTHEGTDSYFVTFNEAYNEAQNGDTVTLLADAKHEITEVGGKIEWNKSLTIDLGGNTLTADDDLKLVARKYTFQNGTVACNITANGSSDAAVVLTLGDNFKHTGDILTIENYATLNITNNNVKVKKLGVYGSTATCALTKGTFGEVAVDESSGKYKTVISLLADGYAFYTTEMPRVWYDQYHNADAAVIYNVGVNKQWIKGVTLTVDQDSYTFGDTVKLTATVDRAEGDTVGIYYEWYQDGDTTYFAKTINDSNHPSETPNLCDYSPSSAGTHKIYVKVTTHEYTRTSDPITVTVNKAAPDYTAPTANALTYDGNAQALVQAGTVSNGTMRYRLGETGAWSDDVPTATNAGKYTVYWYIEGDKNYENVGSAEDPRKIEVTISAQLAVSTSGTPTALTYTSYLQPLLTEEWISEHVTVTGGGNTLPADQYSLLYKLAEDSAWANAIPAATNVDSYTVYIRAIPAGDGIGVYTESAAETLNVGIGKGTHSVVWLGTSDTMTVTYGDTDASVAYSSDPWHDGFYCTTGSLTYAVTAGADVVSVDGSTGALTIHKVGSATVTATAAEDSNYNAGSATITVEVKAKTLTDSMIAATVKEFTYDGQPHTPTYTVKDGETTLVKDRDYTVSGDTSKTDAHPNHYDLEINGTGNYTGTARLQWYIYKAKLTKDSITASETEFTYEPDTEQGPTFKVTVGGRELTQDIDYSVDGIRKELDAGEYTITVTGSDPNYEGSATLTWKITPKTLTAEDAPTAYTDLKYNGNAQLLIKNGGAGDNQGGGKIMYCATKDGEYSTFNDLYNDQTSCFWGKDVDTYTIWWKVVISSTNWKDSEPQELTVSIAKGDATAPTGLAYYVGSKLSAVHLPDGWTWVDGTQTLSGEDDQTYYANYAGNDNYNSAQDVAVTVKVLPKDQRPLVVSMDGWTYGDMANTPDYAIPEGASDATIKYVGRNGTTYDESTTVPTDAGEYTVKVSYETVTEIYTGTKDFTISRKDIKDAVITLYDEDSTYLIYNGNEKTRTVTSVTVDGKPLAADTDYTVGGDLTGTNAGNYTIAITGEGNYTGTATTSWSIDKAALSASVSAVGKVYDGTTNATVNVTFNGLQNGEALVKDTDYTVTAAFEDANYNWWNTTTVSYTVTLKDSATAKNYGFSTGTGTTSTVTGTTTAIIEQKSVPLTITVADKTYDGGTGATVTAKVDSADLIAGDEVNISGLTGTFEDANVGTGKTVTIGGTIIISGNGSDNYLVAYPTTARGNITPAASGVTQAPTANTLTYNGTAQALVTAGTASGGKMQYSLDGASWSETVPTGVNATDYTVWYKVAGDGNHSDTQPVSIPVTISKAALTVTANDKAITYGDAPANNGVTCSGFVGGETESVLSGKLDYGYSYTQYGNAGDYTITPRGLTSDNYTVTFVPGTLTVTQKVVGLSWTDTSLTYNGSAQKPSATATGLVNDDSCAVTVTGEQTDAGDNYTATAAALSNSNYTLPGDATASFTIARKDITHAVITLGESLTYTGAEQTQTVASVIIDGLSVTFDITGNTGTNAADYTLTVTGTGNFTGTATTSWSISPAASGVTQAPTANTLTYNGTAQALVTAGTASGGTMQYSLDGASWSETVPTGVNATDYTVWYKVAGDGNHSDTQPASIPVTIGKATVTVTALDKSASAGAAAPDFSKPVADRDYTLTGLFGTDTPEVTVVLTCRADMHKAGSYDIVPSVTGEDSRYDFVFVNGKLTVFIRPVAPSAGSTTKNPDGSTTTTTTDKSTGEVTETTKNPDGTTVTTVTDKNGSLTAVSASIPASAAKDGDPVLLSIHGVQLTDSRANALEIRIDVPSGGAAIEIPVEDPTPGTVVILVNSDGTETVLPGSRVTENGVAFTLESSATVKVVDNSQTFSDVKPGIYYADAVAWASSRDITGGVGNDRFAPDASCTRAQIVTFLWRAAGSPEPKATGSFTDVSADAYYAKAVAWAVENDITGGIGNSLFAPDQTCTRTQTVTFLFRYAAAVGGTDAAVLQELVSGYSDAASVPGYALSAFNWALKNGVVTGNNGSLMPNSDCTRAQIVTMLYRLLGE